jgi:hypothetical protein
VLIKIIIFDHLKHGSMYYCCIPLLATFIFIFSFPLRRKYESRVNMNRIFKGFMFTQPGIQCRYSPAAALNCCKPLPNPFCQLFAFRASERAASWQKNATWGTVLLQLSDHITLWLLVFFFFIKGKLSPLLGQLVHFYI